MINDPSRPLIVVGVGGMGREVFWLARRAGLEVKGFLDDRATSSGMESQGGAVLGEVASFAEHPEAQFVLGIGSPGVRRAIARRMGQEVKFATLVDPQALVDPAQVRLGAGSVICAGVMATVNIALGAHCIVNLNVTLTHDIRMGDFCTLAPLAAISGGVWMGEGVEVGTGAAVKQNVRLAHDSMVGMGAVVLRDTEPHGVYVGNPARLLKQKTSG